MIIVSFAHLFNIKMTKLAKHTSKELVKNETGGLSEQNSKNFYHILNQNNGRKNVVNHPTFPLCFASFFACLYFMELCHSIKFNPLFFQKNLKKNCIYSARHSDVPYSQGIVQVTVPLPKFRNSSFFRSFSNCWNCYFSFLVQFLYQWLQQTWFQIRMFKTFGEREK